MIIDCVFSKNFLLETFEWNFAVSENFALPKFIFWLRSEHWLCSNPDACCFCLQTWVVLGQPSVWTIIRGDSLIKRTSPLLRSCLEIPGKTRVLSELLAWTKINNFVNTIPVIISLVRGKSGAHSLNVTCEDFYLLRTFQIRLISRYKT